MKKFFIFLFIIFFSEFIYAEPPLQRWVNNYNGTGNYEDFSSDIAIDNLGNVYVTGQSYDSNIIPNYATIKYDANGNQVWAACYNGLVNDFDSGKAIAVDYQGNVYVTGDSWGGMINFDFATIKYDSNGNQLWAARYNGPANDRDNVATLAIDNGGNVYVTGTSFGFGTLDDYATVKYDPNGNRIWAARSNIGNNDYSYAIALDISGNVYVTGGCQESNYDYATIKYSSDGNQIWVARYNGPSNSNDTARSIALDSAGNIYVTGESVGNGTAIDFATVKYDSNGHQIWVARYSGKQSAADDYATSVAVDNSGDIYVAGFVWKNTSYDYATLKYEPNGTLKWAQFYNGTGNSDDILSDLTLDAAGNAYITGVSATNTGLDYVTIKYDPNGNQEWISQNEGPQYWQNAAHIAADNLGNVCISGSVYSYDTANDFITVKYTQHNYCASSAGDFDGNCKVDFADYALLAQSWRSGNDWNDLKILTDNWLKCGFALQEDCW